MQDLDSFMAYARSLSFPTFISRGNVGGSYGTPVSKKERQKKKKKRRMANVSRAKNRK